MFVDVVARRQEGRGCKCVDGQPLAAGLNQLAQRLERRIPAPVLVGRDDWLRCAGAPGQLSLSKPMPPSNLLEKLARIHPAIISICL
jgi:hypothetical protein